MLAVLFRLVRIKPLDLNLEDLIWWIDSGRSTRTLRPLLASATMDPVPITLAGPSIGAVPLKLGRPGIRTRIQNG